MRTLPLPQIDPFRQCLLTSSGQSECTSRKDNISYKWYHRNIEKQSPPGSQSVVIRRSPQKEWSQKRMITHQSGSAWDTLMTNASPVWPERVRPLLSTIVPEIWIEQSKLCQQHRLELWIQSQKQNKMSKLTFFVFLQGRELWHSNSKAALFSLTVTTDECQVPRGGVGKPQKQRKGKVTETKPVSKKALRFTPPVPLEKTSPQIPQVILVSCCSTSDSSNTPVWLYSILTKQWGPACCINELAACCLWCWMLHGQHTSPSALGP